ncbi:hypothetical protein ACFVGV_00370 [Pseudarthrobacter scleromae]|uniref:hypothetical protein n=1 Tax=Pseudarthrobacter scleromae TaxID=158897 RepID=UPI003643DD95
MQAPLQFLHFGPWAAELRGEELADIRYRGNPVLRGMRAVVRDHNWLTLTPEVQSLRTERSPEQLTTVLETTWHNEHSRYRGITTLVMDHNGLSLSFRGTAVEDFSSNRIGLVVLHRPDDAGRPVIVTSPDGSTTSGTFPRNISPHQPFMNIAAMAWDRDNTAFVLDFEGDVFETEDQRNWTDASFKTYGTPLSKPFPVAHAAGDEVRQSVRLIARRTVTITDKIAGTVPHLGTSAAPVCPSRRARGEAKGLTLCPVLVEVAVQPHVAAATISAGEAAALSDALDADLDVRIVANSPGEVAIILRTLPLGRAQRLGVYDGVTHVTSSVLWEALVRASRELGFGGDLVAGARSHFTELNRNPGSARSAAAGATYSITPQMHAVELTSMVETLPMQTLSAINALRISGNRPLHLGPVTLAPRFNAVATEAPQDPDDAAPDPLTGSSFAAAWLLGSIEALTIPGVASISYGTTAELALPSGTLLQQLARQTGMEILATDNHDGSGIAVYPVRDPQGLIVYAANLTDRPASIRVIAPGGQGHDLDLAPWQTLALPGAGP